MKKFLWMIAAVAMMVSCTGSDSAAAGEEFSVANGISGTTGSKNCFLVELGAPIEFTVAENGDQMDVTAKVTVTHSEKTDLDESPRDGAELWVSGRDDDNKDVKLTLQADNSTVTALREFFEKPQGEKIELEFKGKASKDDLSKLNGKECTNTLVI